MHGVKKRNYQLLNKSEEMDSLVTQAKIFQQLFGITIMRPNVIHKIREHKQRVLTEKKIIYHEININVKQINDNDDILRFAHMI